MTAHYANKISEAISICQKYMASGKPIISHIGKSKDAREACAKLFLHAGANLSIQILKSLKNGYLQLAVIGLRCLFEMSVNAIYIFNNPKFPKNKLHTDKISSEYINLIFDKNAVSHTRIDNKSFKARAEEAGLGDVYKRNYRILCDWSHIQGQMPYLYKDEHGEKFGISVAQNTLHALHNIFDPICTFYDFKLAPELEKEVVNFR